MASEAKKIPDTDRASSKHTRRAGSIQEMTRIRAEREVAGLGAGGKRLTLGRLTPVTTEKRPFCSVGDGDGGRQELYRLKARQDPHHHPQFTPLR